MLDYEWGNPSPIILAAAAATEPASQPDPTRHIFDHFPPPFTESTNTHYHYLNPYHDPTHPTHHYLPDPTHFAPFYDPRAYTYSAYTPLEPDQYYNNNNNNNINRYNNNMLMPKTEPAGFGDVTPSSPANRIGLNLGGRTYFSSAEDEFVNRLYNCRSGPVEPVHVSLVRCQAEGCNADLTNVKHYHRRHKVCEFHSKASTVVTGGLTQRFCQQCSRFHLLSEFDNGKRSCRRRLADHNRRRRKSSQNQDHSKSLVTVASTQSISSEITSRYEPD